MRINLFGRTVEYSRRELLTGLFIFVAYLAAAQIGRFLFTAPAVIQPAAGVALAALVIYGVRMWPAVALGAAVNTVAISGAPFIVAFGGILGHTLHAALGAGVLRAFSFDPAFRRLRDMYIFICVALSAAVIIPAIGLFGIALNNVLFDADWPVRVTFFSWWAGIMIGNFAITPLIVRWITDPEFLRTRLEWIETSAALIASVVITYSISWIRVSERADGAFLILWFVMFIWFGLRLGTRFTFLAYFLTIVTAITGILYGTRQAVETAGERLPGGELLLAAIGIILFLFLALMEERKRVAQALRDQLERVQELLARVQAADRTKSEFIAVFAHELRNPLAQIVSAAELLKMRTDSLELAPVVGMIEDRAHTMARLLDDLLDITRINEGKLRLKRERADLGSITRKAEASIRPQIEKRAQSLSVSIPEETLTIDADPVRIEQAVSNLLSNASKFSRDGGHIELSVRRDMQEGVITVQDSGIGITPEMLPRIFEPFLQIESQHRVNEGLGIGLSLTQNLIESHGGTISVASEGAGRGAEFTVRLPLVEPMSATPPRMDPAENVASGRRVLIVDDNEAAANSLGMLLRHYGHTIECAYTGDEVAGRVRAFQPESIILDIGLPDKSGYDVARGLRAAGFSGRIIALSGYGQEEDKKKAVEAGFNDHLTKPARTPELLAKLFPGV